jgi:cytochrome c oxidase subunit 4
MSEHVAPRREYYIIFAWLMALLVITVLAATRDWGTAGTVIAYIIASVKAVLIILYFMHVRYSTRLTWVFAGASFLWLGILLALTMSDYVSRPRANLQRADPMTILTSRKMTSADVPERR